MKENLQDARAAYGKRILATVSRELRAEFGDGFTLRSLYRSIQFFELFPDEAIVSTLSAQLSWSHFIELLPFKDPLARDFYAEMCRIERWDVRTLRQKIGGMLFQRTALSKNTKTVISAEIANLRNGRMTPDTIFRDPYFLDFLGLKSAYSERDLESAILREIEGVLLELGSGFAFVARQKRMSVGKDDFHLDLLFYHRHLRRLIAVELKLESFQPAHVGQMEFYLRSRFRSTVARLANIPGVNCQEHTRDELLKTLRVTLMEALEMNRTDARNAAGKGYEELSIAV